MAVPVPASTKEVFAPGKKSSLSKTSIVAVVPSAIVIASETVVGTDGFGSLTSGLPSLSSSGSLTSGSPSPSVSNSTVTVTVTVSVSPFASVIV